MDSPEARLIHQLVALAPELDPVYRTHLDDNFGELLPHLMMGDITRWMGVLVSRVQAGGPTALADLEQFQTVVAFLEEQFASGADAIQELIVVSFVENLWQTGEQFAAIKNALGPSLRGQFDQMYPSLQVDPPAYPQHRSPRSVAKASSLNHANPWSNSATANKRGAYDVCGCAFAKGNPVTPRQVRIWSNLELWLWPITSSGSTVLVGHCP